MNQLKNKANITAPLVSFVITIDSYPVQYIEECLKSILQLSLNVKEREIILIDNGNDECCINELAGYLDDIVYLRLPKLGNSITRNYGLKLAKGKYIQFIEGDDYLLQPTYEHCLDIVRFHNPDIVTFCFSKDDTGEPSYELPTPISGTEYLYNNTLLGSACSYIFRRAIVGSLLFSPNISFGEDEEFTPQLFLRAERIFKTQTSPYYNRVDKYAPGELENKDKIDIHMDNKLEVILHLQKLLDTVPVAERQALNRRIAQLSMDYLVNNIRLKHSLISLNHAIRKLRKHGLYPLPNKEYTKKYMMFRKMIGTYVGRIALLFLIKK